MTLGRVSPNQRRTIGLVAKEIQLALMSVGEDCQETATASPLSLLDQVITQTCWLKVFLKDQWTKTWLRLGIKFQHPLQLVRPKTPNQCIMIRELSQKKTCSKRTGKTVVSTVEMSLNLTGSQLLESYKMIIKVIIIINRK
jgi:hypothetical protein